MPGIPLIIYAAIAFFLVSTGFATGYKVEGWHRDSLEEKAQQLADLKVKQEQDRAAQASADLEKARQDAQEHVRIITQQVDKIVTRPVYIKSCLDADGLQLVNAALAGSAANPGKSDGALSKPKPTAGWIGSGNPKKAH